MKNLKQQLEKLKKKFESRIENGEFETVVAMECVHTGYVGSIIIKIDGERFKFSLPEKKNYIAQQGGGIDVFIGFNYREQLKPLYAAFEEATKPTDEEKAKKIKDLKKQIQELEK